jgi:hypothetical protein
MIRKVRYKLNEGKLINAEIQDRALQLNITNPPVPTFNRPSIAYKEDGSKVLADEARYKIVGNNVFDGKLEVGGIYGSDGTNWDGSNTVMRTINHLEVKPSTDYAVGDEWDDNNIFFYDAQKNYISYQGTASVNTTPSNCYFIRLTFDTVDLDAEIVISEGTEVEEFNRGALIEEGTTNLVTNSDVENDSDADGIPDGWNTNVYAGTGTFTHADGGYASNKALKIESTSADARLAWVSPGFSVTANVTYTISVYADLSFVAGDTGVFTIAISPGLDGVVSYEKLKNVGTSTNGFQRFEVSFAPTADNASTSIRLWMENIDTGTIALFDRLQVEEKTYKTSWTDGTRSPDTLTLPTDGVLLADEGTVEIEATINELYNYNRVFTARDAIASDRLIIYTTETGNIVFEIVGNDDGLINYAANLQPNILYTISMTWENGTLKAFIDGVKVGEATYSQSVVFDDVMYLAVKPDATKQLNGYISNIRISRVARTDTEIADTYNNGFKVDENTTAYMDFENDLSFIVGGGSVFDPVDISDMSYIKYARCLVLEESGSVSKVVQSISTDDGESWTYLNNGEGMVDLGNSDVLLARIGMSAEDNISTPYVRGFEVLLSDGQNNYDVIEQPPKYNVNGADKMDLFIGETKDMSFEVSSKDGQEFTVLNSSYELIDPRGNVAKTGNCTIDGRVLIANIVAPTTKGKHQLRLKYTVGSETLVHLSAVYVR